MRQMLYSLSALLLIALLLIPNISRANDLWVYTSMYKENITPIALEFEKKNSGVHVQIFQAGSEKIQTKLEAEILSGKVQADLVMISNPFYPYELKKRGAIEPSQKIGENYYSAMVLISHKGLAKDKRPKSFKDLEKLDFKNMVQSGSPLESGSAFSTLVSLQKKYGWEYYKAIQKNNVIFQGGNSTVIQKVETAEKKIGIVLLENALAAKKKGSPIEIIYPEDGAIVIPSVFFVLKDSPNKELSQKFHAFMNSKEAEKHILSGFMYSINKSAPAPDGAIKLSELLKKSMFLDEKTTENASDQMKEIKKKFSQIMMD